jgi:hypothetical protein
MDCNHVRLLVLLVTHSTELDAADAAALQDHLDQCSECGSWALNERQWDETLRRAMRNVPVPTGLSERLLERTQSRSLGRWLIPSAAAILLLVVGVGGYFWLTSRTDFDLAFLENAITEKLGASPESVEHWFAAHGLAMEAPRQFNYALLDSYDFSHDLDPPAPLLVFIQRNNGEPTGAIAKVYVLPESKYHVRPDQIGRFAASSHSIQVMRSPGFVFVVTFTGESLRIFLKDGGA